MALRGLFPARVEEPTRQPDGSSLPLRRRDLPVARQAGPLRVTVTVATGADGATLADLANAARSEKATQRGGAMLLASRYPEECDAEGIVRALRDGARRFWLGALDGAAVGFAAARVTRLADGSPIAGVEALYVLPEARGVGLGEALMEEVLAWATAAGAVGVDSIALPGDRVTKNFFERYGLTARALQVYRSLSPVPEPGPD